MAEEKEKPLTREDVLRLIEENRGLNLSGKNLEGIDLSELNLSELSEIIFTNANLFRAKFDGSSLPRAVFVGANLHYATFNSVGSETTNLEGAHFRGAHLYAAEFRGANLIASYWGDALGRNCAHLDSTDLRGANLFLADFTNCYFYGTKLEGAYLRGANISGSHLEEADWGSYVIGEERKGEFYFAEHVYRQMKKWYTDAGMYDIAGEFFFREMIVRRKALKWWPNPLPRAWSKFISLICGYGERPFRVVISAAVVVFGLALIYFGIGTLTPNTFLNSLYYSAVSFTALGYGSWAPEPTGWVKGLGAFEAFTGVFMMALFLVTFIRKMTR